MFIRLNLILLFGCLATGGLHADIADDRKDAYDTVVNRVNAIEKDLKSAGSLNRSTGQSAYNRASAKRKQLERDISELTKLAKGDSSLESQAKNYKRALQVVSSAFTHIKTARAKWDPILTLEAACEEESEQLNALVTDLEGDLEAFDNNPDAVRDAAEEAYDRIDDRIGDADLRLTSIQKRVRQIRQLGFPDDWRALHQAFVSAGDDMAEGLGEIMKKAHRACDPILKGVRSDFVLDYLDDIQDLDEERNQFVEDGRDWLTRSKHVFNTSCQEKKNIHRIAASIDWENKDTSDDSALTGEVNRQKAAIKKSIGGLMSEYKSLNRRADSLPDEEETTNMRQLMRQRVAWFAGALKDEKRLFVGARDPLIRKILDYGVDAHDRLQGSFGCELSELKVGGTNRRLDCFDAERCTVWEFKPRGGDSKGQGQADFYARHLANDFGDIIKKAIAREAEEGTTDPGDPRPSIETVKAEASGNSPLAEVYELMLDSSGCISDDGSVNLDAKVHTYNPFDASKQLRCDDPLGKY